MTYRGYTAAVAYDADDRLFSGRIVDLRDVVHFEGTSVEELEAAMRATVDDYLAYCTERGEEPDRPYSGRVGLRLDAALHRAAAARAAAEGKSLNDFIAESLAERVGASPA